MITHLHDDDFKTRVGFAIDGAIISGAAQIIEAADGDRVDYREDNTR